MFRGGPGLPQNIDSLVKLQRRRGDMVKTDKSWKKVRFSQWNIWLSDRLLLEWYNKTTKKNWNRDVVGSTAKKGFFLDVFFRNHENYQAKNHSKSHDIGMHCQIKKYQLSQSHDIKKYHLAGYVFAPRRSMPHPEWRSLEAFSSLHIKAQQQYTRRSLILPQRRPWRLLEHCR